MSVLDDLERARLLQLLGVEVRSAELEREAARFRDFYERGGNRAMRRAAKRKRGRR